MARSLFYVLQLLYSLSVDGICKKKEDNWAWSRRRRTLCFHTQSVGNWREEERILILSAQCWVVVNLRFNCLDVTCFSWVVVVFFFSISKMCSTWVRRDSEWTRKYTKREPLTSTEVDKCLFFFFLVLGVSSKLSAWELNKNYCLWRGSLAKRKSFRVGCGEVSVVGSWDEDDGEFGSWSIATKCVAPRRERGAAVERKPRQSH